MPTRSSFHDALDELWEQMAALARLDAESVARASLALVDTNRQLAELVISANSVIDESGRALEDRAAQLLALQSPVAGDLRLVMSIFPLSSALTRMGGLARHIARLTRLRAPQPVVSDAALLEIVAGMSETAGAMTQNLVQALAHQDADAARAVEQADERMDSLYVALLTRARDLPADAIDSAVDAALLGRFYERFADQAVDAARRVHYVLVGTRNT